MTQAEIEGIILGFLAEQAGCTPAELRAQLLALGAEMSVDSVLAVEVLVQVQNATGVVLPATVATARAMGSVSAFAAAVVRQLEAGRAGRASA